MPPIPIPPEIEARFWAKVRKGDGCWEWAASKKGEYGSFGLGRKTVKAHRIAYQIARGPIPVGQCVCHSCDNPACVNPAHLWLGTHKENMDDRGRKGRARGGRHPGELAPHARLTARDVSTIRVLCAAGYLQKDCAVLWGVNKATVNDLVLRKTWGHVT